VLFSDIRDFTQLSERLGPQETVKLLNECFTLMVDVILKHNGTLDKYLGDGLMAVFGAPYPSGDDAADALRAAIGMLQALRAFNRRRATATLPRLQMGFGLNTAEVVSGNIGSLKRMDYTVIGDGVNLASRLEGANREYGTQLLVSEFTMADLTGTYLLREVDRLRVRGRQQPVAVFEVLDYSPPEILPHLRYVVSLYNEGLDRYRQRQWEAGVKMFEEALQLKPDDGPAQLYRRRCEHFAKSPPPDNWDGVWVLTSK
jgi:adenylate cyclase